ncbi:hypothetical protein EOD42_24740 [Rhodovarius crocodyli]|uniref:Uncharacterized protein n=1 Tax=Rhodovarius crocodyli TaxID=1979269 RepID=A0A437LW38_9PROT|nr:hypothetical protein [Rhodovarius crocodyli]RVT89608.1 hypothetical protein EOD42_24740 [Rhodovarius crocodyli]
MGELLNKVTGKSSARCFDDEIERHAVLQHGWLQNVEQAHTVEIVEVDPGFVEEECAAKTARTGEKKREREIL